MEKHSRRIVFSLFSIILVIFNSARLSQGNDKESVISGIRKSRELLPPKLRQVKEWPPSQFGRFMTLLENFTQKNMARVLWYSISQSVNYIDDQYKNHGVEKLISRIESIPDNDIGSIQKITNEFTDDGSTAVPTRLEQLIELISPSEDDDSGIIHQFLNYVSLMDKKNGLCGERQSVSSITYTFFQFVGDIIKKGYSMILQSYAILQAVDKEKGSENRNKNYLHIVAVESKGRDYHAEIESTMKNYESATKRILKSFRRLESDTVTSIRRCDPPRQERGETFLEMNKFLQGFLPYEVTLNKKHSASGGCEDYTQDVQYYPWDEYVKPGEPWSCSGLVYNCFEISEGIDVCPPALASRRMAGFRWSCTRLRFPKHIEACEENGRLPNPYPHGITYIKAWGNVKNCKKPWHNDDRKLRRYNTWYTPEYCACVCDDSKHPKTLRKFSRESTMSDYKNNMVVTGIRFVNIANVIHLEIQQGKLEEYGFINSTTVQWRSKNVGEKEAADNVITLSYHKRRINLDAIYAAADEVVIGAAFDWDDPKKGVVLSIFVTPYSFSTGEVDKSDPKTIAKHSSREEIVLTEPHVPTVCSHNTPVNKIDKFINFQTTDWKKDAAQTTIPYLDIQEVVTNPPTLLRGLGLYYKNAAGCGGYIGLELHSHDHADLINYYNNHLL